jgi:hypothetical protein
MKTTKPTATKITKPTTKKASPLKTPKSPKVAPHKAPETTKETPMQTPRKAEGYNREVGQNAGREPLRYSDQEAKPPRDPETMSVKECRQEYSRIRSRSHADSVSAFDAEVKRYLAAKLGDASKATPAQWVKAARNSRFKCRECCGTGLFITMIVNGRPKSPNGEMHFRCEGKGWRNDGDERRNYGYDMHRPIYL